MNIDTPKTPGKYPLKIAFYDDEGDMACEPIDFEIKVLEKF